MSGAAAIVLMCVTLIAVPATQADPGTTFNCRHNGDPSDYPLLPYQYQLGMATTVSAPVYANSGEDFMATIVPSVAVAPVGEVTPGYLLADIWPLEVRYDVSPDATITKAELVPGTGFGASGGTAAAFVTGGHRVTLKAPGWIKAGSRFQLPAVTVTIHPTAPFGSVTVSEPAGDAMRLTDAISGPKGGSEPAWFTDCQAADGGPWALSHTTIDPPATDNVVSVDSAAVHKPTTGLAAMAFKVHMNKVRAHDVVFHYSTHDATAVAGTDYLPIEGTLDIAAGSTEQTIWVAIPATATPYTSFFNLSVDNPVNAVLDVSNVVGIISS